MASMKEIIAARENTRIRTEMMCMTVTNTVNERRDANGNVQIPVDLVLSLIGHIELQSQHLDLLSELLLEK